MLKQLNECHIPHKKHIPLNIIYQDDTLVVINKPAGMMTHRSRIAEDNEPSAMEILRDQLGTWVYPIHRLDRATSGVLLFGLSQDSARHLHEGLAQGQVEKSIGQLQEDMHLLNNLLIVRSKKKRSNYRQKSSNE